MNARLRRIAHFWSDFVIGDDWRVALGIAVALGVTYAVSRTTVASWWIVPVAIGVVLPVSLWRSIRRR
jgi:hypothetical protein